MLEGQAQNGTLAAQTSPVPSMTSVLLSIHFFICYYYVIYMHFSSNPVTPDEYNAIKTCFIIQLKDISLSRKHSMLALKAPLHGSEVSAFSS